jgi:hypothetical protein
MTIAFNFGALVDESTISLPKTLDLATEFFVDIYIHSLFTNFLTG